MKRISSLSALLFGVMILFSMPVFVHAKEIPADGNIPLTSEYFPDAWFLERRAQSYDKDKNGYLSPEEVAAVTTLECRENLSDFSQLQYFTNLRKLELVWYDSDDYFGGVWVGTDIDLTAFPNLEDAVLFLDSRKAPADGSTVQIKASGLSHLKNLNLHDEGAKAGENAASTDIRIDTIDLRGTKELECVRISDAKRVVFDDVNQIKILRLTNMADIPVEQISRFEALEELRIDMNLPGITGFDVSKNSSLKTLFLKNDYLEEVELAGADALHTVTVESGALDTAVLPQMRSLVKLELKCPGLKSVELAAADGLEDISIESDALTGIDLSKNKRLKSVSLTCPKLKALNVQNNRRLESLSVVSGGMASIDVRKNVNLTHLAIHSDRLKSLDVAKNANLTSLQVSSKTIKGLNLKKNKKLVYISVKCKRLAALDLSANKKLQRLWIDGTPLASLNLSKLKELQLLSVMNNSKLTKLDLSKNVQISYLYVQKNTALRALDLSKLTKLYWLEATGNKKLTKLDLSGNKRLSVADVSSNALKNLKIGSKTTMGYLDCSKNKLTSLNLSKAVYLTELTCDRNVKVKGYKGKITRV